MLVLAVETLLVSQFPHKTDSVVYSNLCFHQNILLHCSLAMFESVLRGIIASLPLFGHCTQPTTYGVGFHLSLDYG
jgi:hypothetical protein